MSKQAERELFLRVGFGEAYHKFKWIKVGHKEMLSTVCGFDCITWNIAWLPTDAEKEMRKCKRCFAEVQNKAAL